MKFALPKIIALLCACCCAPLIHADQATSANYSMAISIEGGGGLSTSDDYQQDLIVTPITGRAVATFSDSMIFGFATRFNSPPIAANDVRSHPKDAPVNITATSLLANDFEPEGDLLSIIAVDATSAGGATVTLNGQTITYTPPAGQAGLDQFRYTVSDESGDITTATVTMAIAPPLAEQPMNTISITPQPDGKYLIRFRQEPGKVEYIIEFTDDLSNREWELLGDVHAGADGILELLFDPAANRQTFFRALVF